MCAIIKRAECSGSHIRLRMNIVLMSLQEKVEVDHTYHQRSTRHIHGFLGLSHAGLADPGVPHTLQGHVDDVASGVFWLRVVLVIHRLQCCMMYGFYNESLEKLELGQGF